MTRMRPTVVDRCNFGANSTARLVFVMTPRNSNERADYGTSSHRSFDKETQGLTSTRVHCAGFEQYADHTTILPTSDLPV